MRATMLMMLSCAVILAVVPGLAAAQNLDCGKPVGRAQKAVDKVTDDMKGMEQMPKEQVEHVNALLDDARKSLEGAKKGCEAPQNDYERARAMGAAEAAHGYAVAADRLHFQYMKGMKAMGGMKDKGMSGMSKMGGDMKSGAAAKGGGMSGMTSGSK